jgi:tRNA nucleotidyltransferase (CCA-adding enzyme)
MADYIYLLENRLSGAQRGALKLVREIAKAKGLTVFLVGGAVRDLTSGSPVRDLDVVVQGDARKLKKDIEKAGGAITGEVDTFQALYVRFPGSVRMELGSTLSVSYPKPGKPVVKPATILDDLRRRDFTANAMAISLNEGSYGLLMDPLNGVADIENRELRLVSNYGFIEDPVRMIRAARLMARLGWTMDEKTQQRYRNAVDDETIKVLGEFHRGYELEEIVHEEDPLRVLKRLEAEGWMKHLAPFWTAAKVNEAELERLRDVQTQLQMQGIHPDTASAHFPLLTAKLHAKEIATLKAGFARPGFVRDVEALEAEAKEFAAQLGGKGAAAASDAWKLITSAKPEAVLWAAFSNKGGALQAKFKSFYTEWPEARTKIPYTTMQEMRITPELAGYDELLEKLFFELMDGRLQTVEEIKAFLEPYSPPAPPPPVSTRRPRAAKKEAKGRGKKEAKAEESDVEIEGEMEGAPPVEEEVAGKEPKPELPEAEEVEAEEPKEEAPQPAAANHPGAKAAKAAPAVAPAAAKPEAANKSVTAVLGKPTAAKVPVKTAVKATVVKAAAKTAASAKTAVKAPAKKAVAVKAPAKKTAGAKNIPAKKAVAAKKSVPAKKTSPVAKKAAPAKTAKKAAPAKAKSAAKHAGRRR